MCNNFELYSCLGIFGYKFVWRNLRNRLSCLFSLFKIQGGLLFTTLIRLYRRHFSANM